MNAVTFIIFNTIHTFKIQMTSCLCLLDTDPNFPTSQVNMQDTKVFLLRDKAMQSISDIILTCTVVVVAAGLGKTRTTVYQVGYACYTWPRI